MSAAPDNPALYRPIKGRLELKMPSGPLNMHNRQWLKDSLGSVSPRWSGPPEYRWEIGKNHLFPLIESLLERWPAVDLDVDYSTTQKCDTRCRRAKLRDCVCSCLGEHHGGVGRPREWIRVGETTLISPEVQRVSYSVKRPHFSLPSGH